MKDHFVAIAIANDIIDKEEVELEAYQEFELLTKKIKVSS